MPTPTTANAVYETSTGDLLRWGTGVDFSAADDFDPGTETYRTDLPYPGLLKTSETGFDYHNWNGSAWVEKEIITKGSLVYGPETFADFDDWDTGSGGSFDVFDDLPDASIFSPACLRLPASTTGRIAIKTTNVSQADMWLRVKGYNRVDNADSMKWFIGLRVDYIADDGYYIGFDATPAESKIQIIRRVAGVDEIIYNGIGLRSLGIVADQELIYLAIIKGSRMEFRILNASDSTLLTRICHFDKAITGAGTAGVAIFNSATVSQRLDGLRVSNVV